MGEEIETAAGQRVPEGPRDVGVEAESRPRGQQESSVGRLQVTALTLRKSERTLSWVTQDGDIRGGLRSGWEVSW